MEHAYKLFFFSCVIPENPVQVERVDGHRLRWCSVLDGGTLVSKHVGVYLRLVCNL